MALRNIVKKADDVLTKMCRPVEVGRALYACDSDMYETMEDANGVGLAAPPRSVCYRRMSSWHRYRRGTYWLISPESLRLPASRTAQKGCLSFPGEFGMVEAPDERHRLPPGTETAKRFEESAAQSCWPARSAAMKLTTANGVCFVARASAWSRTSWKAKTEFREKGGISMRVIVFAGHRILPYRASTRFWSAVAAKFVAVYTQPAG